MLDYLIVGAGPAGLQFGYFANKAGRSYKIVEAGPSAGTFFVRYPRHRKLLSINKIYTGYDDFQLNLRWDWNSLLSDSEAMSYKHYSKDYFPDADTLVDYCQDFAKHFDLDIDYETRINQISKDNGHFDSSSEAGRKYQSKKVIIASGLTKPYMPSVPGIELTESYCDVSVDPEDFIGKKVLIIGKGNSGFETADNLVSTAAVIHICSPTPVKMAWQTHYVGHLRAINNSILDTYQLKAQNAALDADIKSITKTDDGYEVTVAYAHAHGEVETLHYDNVINCTGFAFDQSIFDDSCKPRLCIDDRFPAQTSEWESTNVKDLYFVGTITQARDFKKTTSAFIHGFRYNARALHYILEHKDHSTPWPGRTIENTPEALRDAVIDRVNSTSALWQQFGFLTDLIVLSKDKKSARYYEALPFDFIRSSENRALDPEYVSDHYYTITLEYGTQQLTDPFNVLRIERNDADRADQSQFLHPIVRHFRDTELLAEHHIIEDLAAEWVEKVHTEPLLGFFEQEEERLPASAAPEAVDAVKQ